MTLADSSQFDRFLLKGHLFGLLPARFLFLKCSLEIMLRPFSHFGVWCRCVQTATFQLKFYFVRADSHKSLNLVSRVGNDQWLWRKLLLCEQCEPQFLLHVLLQILPLHWWPDPGGQMCLHKMTSVLGVFLLTSGNLPSGSDTQSKTEVWDMISVNMKDSFDTECDVCFLNKL